MFRLRLLDLLGKTTINTWFAFLKRSEYWEQAEIKHHQNIQLQKLIDHCYHNVPYYKDQFDKLGLVPGDFKSPEDLQKLPVLRKSDILLNRDMFIANNYKKYKPVNSKTGGSTGEPMSYLTDRSVKSLEWAYKFLTWTWGGYHIGEKMGVLGGGSLFADSKVSIKNSIRNRLYAFSKYPMTSFSQSKISSYKESIESKKISFLRGYPSALAAYAENTSSSTHNISAVFPTAEVLTPEYRKEIEEGLSAEVFNQYGCGDAGVIACECAEHQGLHVLDQAVVTEVLHDDKQVADGEEGELVFTSLYRYAMPFLRYSPEDLGVKSKSNCACGRETTLLSSVSGRTSDVILFANGNSLAGPAMTLIFSRVNVKRYQLIQESINTLDILIIPNADFSLDDREKISNAMTIHTGSDVIISLKEVDDIPLPSSGKFRYAISKVNKHEKN